MIEIMLPFLISTLDSSTVPLATISYDAFNSRSSLCKRIVSNKVSTPVPFKAEISTKGTSPPHSSGIKP